jgi:pimeloyl-ACP methyl ester carboxylesterase
METRLPDAERVTIAGAGHIVNIEAADAFNAVVCDFLGRLSGGS